jgi:FlaA1/EpsC-like NDP-sugar epimerase
VNPSSIMGATKLVAERLVHDAAVRNGNVYVSVRFGNVLASRGSVVPLFRKQIADGGPVTVTDPGMCRYFMTIPEAVQLVLQAAALGNGGETFVLDMGEPVKILDLAKDIIKLSGLELGRDIEIKFTGLRPGEKMFEELFLDDEEFDRTWHEKIFVAKNGKTPAVDPLRIDQLLAAATEGQTTKLRHHLNDLLPGGKSSIWAEAAIRRQLQAVASPRSFSKQLR